ncbi:RHS repeat-associated core domain-containing protein [Herbiconiux ginsengi]|uniref:RHS repeat-associated core domain-containing protein n=1 Tax=Herbiconiux ginsengi TaxID=381665 RepID=UPI001C3191B7|nr:RHS repeat-associated core domain-containing protein [Herbiconiux ginsengi]
MSIPITGDPVADAAARKWAYPNIHGDNTWTADNTGARTGVFLYDPFGQPLDLANKVIGSVAADDAVPDTMPGSYDTGWVGSNGKGYEHLGSIAIIEMGVRMYSPMLGRFLANDPVAGGNTSWYNYPNDPINTRDLDGKRALGPYDNHWGYNEGSNRAPTGTVQSKKYNPWTDSPQAKSNERAARGTGDVLAGFQGWTRSDGGKVTSKILSGISVVAGFAALGLAASGGGLPFAPAAAILSEVTGAAGTVMDCTADIGGFDCAWGAGTSALGVAAIGRLGKGGAMVDDIYNAR